MRIRREILHVAGDHGEAVALGGGHEQAVHHRQGLPGQFGVRGDLRPDVKGGGIERQDASGEALFHLAQPGGEFLAAARVGLRSLRMPFSISPSVMTLMNRLASSCSSSQAITFGAGAFLAYSESAQVSSSQLTVALRQ